MYVELTAEKTAVHQDSSPRYNPLEFLVLFEASLSDLGNFVVISF